MRDHNLIIKSNEGDEIGFIKVGVMNDGSIGVIDSSLIWNHEDEQDDEDHTVLCEHPKYRAW